MLEGELSAQSPGGASSLMPAGMGLGLPLPRRLLPHHRVRLKSRSEPLYRGWRPKLKRRMTVKEFMNMQNEKNGSGSKRPRTPSRQSVNETKGVDYEDEDSLIAVEREDHQCL